MGKFSLSLPSQLAQRKKNTSIECKMQVKFESNRLAEKDSFFREFSVWPVFEEFNSEEWLSNFSPCESWVGERLLTNFTYYNERMTNALLRASISRFACSQVQAQEDTDIFFGKTAFVICEGEAPSPADSGNLFARKLRDRLGVSEANIFVPSDALAQRDRFDCFVFIDDFAGSGDQFVTTWTSVRDVNGCDLSFQELANQRSNYSFAYCCCISTKKAKKEINRVAPVVTLSPAHLLTKRHCAANPQSPIWTDLDANEAVETIRQVSVRAGFSAENGGPEDWRGYRALGLSLAFNHGIPDASLPIYFSQRNGWKPLMTRSQQ